MTETHRSQIAQLKRKIASQDVLLRKCMKYIQSISPKGIISINELSINELSINELSIKEIAIKDEITKPPICFGTYPIVVAGNIKTVELRGDYDCRVIILKNTETNDFTLDIDALEKMTELREIRFQFIQKYMPGVNTAIHLVKMGETINYYAFIGWCSRRRIRLSMTIGGQPVTVDWKAVFF